MHYKQLVTSRQKSSLLYISVLFIRLYNQKRFGNKMSSATSPETSPEIRSVAAMVLAGVGDALGYKNGKWEFCFSGEDIHQELKELGGLKKIDVKLPRWRVSDDTVMHLATADAIREWDNSENCSGNKTELYVKLAEHYKECMNDMRDRAPGTTCMAATSKPLSKKKEGFRIDFNERGGGCGAAMRAMCIGIRYNSPENLKDLIEVSVESGRMTHHHPTGYLGSLAAALFTSYALQGIPVVKWGKGLMDTLPKALEYIQKSKEYVEENKNAWGYFEGQWKDYLKKRQIQDGTGEPYFDKPYGVKERDQFYKDVSFSGWGGSSGHDAPMIAYDAFLGMQAYKGDIDNRWEELCIRGMFHAGDSDSTGTMAACWYGAIYGFEGVPDKNHQNVEYRKRLVEAGEKLYKSSTISAEKQKENATGDSDFGHQTEQEEPITKPCVDNNDPCDSGTDNSPKDQPETESKPNITESSESEKIETNTSKVSHSGTEV